MKRRSFLENTSKAGLFSRLVLGAETIPKEVGAQNAEQHAFLTEPYLQNIHPDAVTIMWISTQNSLNWLEISEPGGTVRKVYKAENGLIQANNRITKINVTGLKSATNYQYQVFSKAITEFKPYKITYGETSQKGPFRFDTPAVDESKVSLVIFNDLHNHPNNIPDLLNKFAPEKEYDFVVFNGDAFNWVDGEEPIIRDLLTPIGTLFSATHPFLMIQGNHEVRGSYARQLFDYFDYPENRCYYAFTRGPVRFVVLDSGEDKADDHQEYSGLVAFDPYREKQAEWLAEEIQSKAFKQAVFRVVLIHIPLFHAGDGHGTLHCRSLFNPLFNKGKIDLSISGHTHKYGTFDADPMTHNYPIVIGGGPGFVGRGGGTRTLIKVQATAKTLALQMLVDDGTVVGSYNLKK